MSAKFFSTAKRIVQAGLVALTMGTATLAAAPAQASSNVNFSFSFSFPNGQVTISNPGWHHRRACVSVWQVVQGFQRHGFWDVRVLRQQGEWVRISAKRGNWEYTYRVNRCTWQVIEIDRDRIHYQGPWGSNHGGYGGNWGGGGNYGGGGYGGGYGGNGNWGNGGGGNWGGWN